MSQDQKELDSEPFPKTELASLPPISLQTRLAILALWLGGLTVFFAGVALLATYLEREHRRLEPWRVVLLWLSEGIALYWFFRFGFRHGVRGEPLPPDQPAPFRRSHWVVLGTLVAGWSVDLVISLSEMRAEARAFARSVPVAGQVVEADSRAAPPGVLFARSFHDLRCEFTDAAAVTHHTQVTLGNLDVPPQTLADLQANRLPAPVAIRYDPGHPSRCWVGEQGGDWRMRIYYLSLLGLVFQAFLLVPIAVSGRAASVLLCQVVPFLMSAGFLLFAGWLRWSTGWSM